MNDKELQRIQDEIMADLNKEQKVEKEIKNSSKEITSHLLISKKINAEIDNVLYMFNYRLINGKQGKRMIYMLVANVTKYQIAGKKYVPFVATAELDDRYSEFDNVNTVVEAFIRHVTGNIKPDILDGE